MFRGPHVVVALAAAVSFSCDRPEPATRGDSADTNAPIAQPAARPSRGSWATELGDMLVVPADSISVLVVYPEHPDGPSVGSAPVALLGPGGDTVAAGATLALDDTLQCGDAAIAHLAAPLTGWTFGVRGGSARGVRLDSVEAFPPRDSARVVAELARLASTLTAQSRSRFTGLPFAVLQARRFPVDGAEAIAAHLVRRLPQEAAPLEEHTLIIAERRGADGPYTAVFSQESQGTEETAQYFDAIGASRAGTTTFLVLVRDATSRTEYQILERTGAGRWRVRWSRPLGC